MATYYVDDGGGKAVTGATKANPCNVTIVGHGFSNGDKVVFHNIGGMTQLNFTNGSTGYTVTTAGVDNITIGVDSTAYGTYTSGGTAHTGTAWGNSYLSLSALDDVFALASGDIIYIGHDHVCQYTHAANRVITGPASDAPCYIISATQGSSPPTYQASTTDQVDTSEGAYQLTLDGCFAIYGVRFKTGARFVTQSDANEHTLLSNCTAAIAANSQVHLDSDSGSNIRVVNLHVDLTADGASNRTGDVILIGDANVDITGLTFTNAIRRQGSVVVLNNLGGELSCSGADFSGFTNATPCEICSPSSLQYATFSNCKTASTWAALGTGRGVNGSEATFVNVGDTDSPAVMYHRTYNGDAENSSINRTSGASVEGTAASWKITTQATCDEARIYYTPYMYGVVSSTGSKTFTVYIGNNTADLTDAECWLEVESMGDAGGSPLSELTTDQRTITTTAANQTDDTTSTWSSAQTYMQSLAVTATVDQAGLFRARVAVAKASVTNLYVDPTVFVDGVAASSQYLLPSGIIGVTSGSTGGAGLVGSGRGLVG